MKAIVMESYGPPDVLKLKQVEDPKIKDDEVLIKVAATALNRGDVLQRSGQRCPLPNMSPYLGLECSGEIISVGSKVTKWKVGDQVLYISVLGMRTSQWRGYTEQVAVPARHVLSVPAGVSVRHAAALPEVACIVWFSLFMLGKLSKGQTLLIHGGAGGVGAFAI